jgi:hypothetical protein
MVDYKVRVIIEIKIQNYRKSIKEVEETTEDTFRIFEMAR